jgi:predicted dehydrogenase
MSKLGVGIVGTGWVSDEYIRSFKMNARTEVRAICSRSIERAKEKATEHGLDNCTPYADYEAMLKQKDIDIVAVLTPNFMHAEQTILAAEAKKHIVIEKPIAIKWSDMLRMQEAVHRNKVKTIVGFVLRWNPLFETAQELIKKDIIGKPFYAEVDYLHRIDETYNCYEWSKKKETGGSILQVGGCHAVDGLRWFMKSEATEVVALSGRYRPDFEQDTTITFVTKFADGSMGKVCCSYDVICPYIYNLKLYADKGTLINDKFWAKEALPGQHDWITLPVVTPDSGDVTHHPFPQEVDHFVSVILDGVECIVDLDDAIKTFEIIEAADRSAENGGMPVKLPLKD